MIYDIESFFTFSLHFLYKCVSFTHDNCPICIYIIMINDKRVFLHNYLHFFYKLLSHDNNMIN